MTMVLSGVRRFLRSPDLRILAVMAAGVGVCGVLDGSLWKTLLTPTIAYRPALLFGLTLVFGWRGFVWSQLIFLVSFAAFMGWRGAVVATPLYLLSHACALIVARRLAREQPWLSSERSTGAFLAGAVLAAPIPALLGSVVLPLVGLRISPGTTGVPAASDSWIRGGAATLAVAPAVLVYLSRPLKTWIGLPAERYFQRPVDRRRVLELSVETAMYAVTLWISVQLKAHYGVNVTYLTFLAPLAFTFFRGMGFAVLALAANTIVATTLWQQLHWMGALSAMDLRLLIASCSLTILLLAAIVDARERSRVEVEKLRAAETAMRESEERFRRVFEEGPLGLALVGKDYRFEKVNNALCKMIGYDEAELVRMSFVDITHPDDVRTDMDLAGRLFKREIPFYRIQKRYLKKNGTVIWINLTASMIHGPDDEPLHGLAMIEDITETKRSQEEALFRHKLESLGTLAGGIAHDFNNLLGAIRAQAEVASSELDVGSSCREELRAIGEVAVRGSEIVRQLMIYAGKESKVVELIDLSKTVDEILSLLKVSVTKRAVIKVELDQDLPPIYANAAQIQQVVMNLITNASDAIADRDGVIRVITRRVRESDLATSSRTPADGDNVELEVSDTGRGMSPQTKAKVFDPFFTTKSPGRGLGLAVVQGIVQSLCGAIRITSEPGKGTTVRVLLPSANTAGRTSQAISIEREPSGASQHATILVVEDEASLRRAVVKMLQKSGFEVIEAADGNSAIDLFREHEHRIDSILLDMTLPGPSGCEIVAEVAKLKPEIRVILTSAYSHEVIEGSIYAPQIRGFIRKPFSFVDLLKIIQSSLSP